MMRVCDPVVRHESLAPRKAESVVLAVVVYSCVATPSSWSDTGKHWESIEPNSGLPVSVDTVVVVDFVVWIM
jgi:hypothetical protein